MSECPLCGAKVQTEDDACSECGAPLADVLTCPDCGAPIEPGQKRCEACHVELESDEPIEAPPDGILEYSDFEPVAFGDVSDMMALQASLGAAGYRTRMPQGHTKIIDPGITGAGAFQTILEAPADTAAEIREVVAKLQARSAEGTEQDVEPGDVDLDALARRAGWASVAIVTIPFGLYWGIRYLIESSRRGKSSRQGWLVASAMLFGLIGLTLIVRVVIG